MSNINKQLPYFSKLFTVTGPYLNKAQGRRFVTLTEVGTNKRTQKTYAKYLMENHLGRFLLKEETVDHIDRNKLNDVIENFQILTQSEHARKDHVKAKLIEVACAWCGEVFLNEPRKMRAQHKQGTAGPFCGSKCRGKYGAHVRATKQTLPQQQAIKSEYYYESDKGEKADVKIKDQFTITVKITKEEKE